MFRKTVKLLGSVLIKSGWWNWDQMYSGVVLFTESSSPSGSPRNQAQNSPDIFNMKKGYNPDFRIPVSIQCQVSQNAKRNLNKFVSNNLRDITNKKFTFRSS